MAAQFHSPSHPGVIKNVNMNGNILQRYLLIRISRGANNCGQHSLEKNIYVIMRFSPHFQLFYFNDRLEFCEFLSERSKGYPMQIYFHSRLCSYLLRVPILLEGTVFAAVTTAFCKQTHTLIFSDALVVIAYTVNGSV